jgi:hypothetical protein
MSFSDVLTTSSRKNVTHPDHNMWMERVQRLYASLPEAGEINDEVIAVGGNMVIVGDEMGRETRRIPVYPPRVVKHCPTCGQQIS